ncbi:hypothetical protein KAX97_05375 [candidate division WOR-3 bacterium]|nr:hypothetical protein [candidate division WOR-3 bacterium]
MIVENKNINNGYRNPDWQGRGSELLSTIQTVKDKVVHSGFLEIEIPYEFSNTFRYPVVIEVKSSGPVIESFAIAFKIDDEMGATKSTIEKNIIVPEVLNTFKRDDFINYLSDIVEKQSKLAFYLNKKPAKFKNLKFHKLAEKQKIIFNEFLIMAIEKVLEKRKSVK